MKISASLYSSKEKKLVELVKELDDHKIDAFHIDCNDDMHVFDDIREIRQISNTPIDLHIISDKPDKFFPYIKDLKIEYVQFQFENLNNSLRIPEGLNTQFGLSIESNTPIEVFEKFQDQFSFILMMTTTPGQSGGKFRKENFQKIRKFRNRFPGKRIHVDGGVNDEVSFILRNMGVNMVISGSFLVNHLSISAALLSMKMQEVHSHYKIRDFMLDYDDLPVLSVQNTSFTEVLQTIEKYNLGFTFFTDLNQRLYGLSSNADVRKGLLQNLDDLNKTNLDQIINKTPVCINQDATISDLLKLIKNKDFIISFLPVVDGDHKLVGAITFFNLIRGEA